MFDEAPEYTDYDKSWTTQKYLSGWYYHDADGVAYGPFSTEDDADEYLGYYEYGYYYDHSSNDL